MNIIVNKNNVVIEPKTLELLNKGEYNVTDLQFQFSEEYTGLPKMAVFSNAFGTYETAITNNACIIPYEVLAKKGTLTIGVYGYTIENNVVTKRYSPTPVTIPINSGSYIPNANNPQQENPTAFGVFVEQIEGNFEDINDDLNAIGQTIEGIQGDITDLQNDKQDKLTAGTNINIDENNVISTTAEANAIDKIKVNNVEQPIVNKAVNISVPTKTSDISNDSGFITKEVNNLTNYELKTDTGHSIDMTIDTDYVLSVSLKNSAGSVLNSKSVDLPLETMIVNGSYDSATKEVVLILNNGNEIRFSIADLVSGLQTEITNDNKLASDLVDDTNQTNKFVSSSDITNWNSKQNAITNDNKLSADYIATSTGKQFVSDTEKTTWNNKSDFTGNYNDLTNKPDLTVYEEKTDAEEKYETLLSQIPTATVTGETINVQDSSNLPIKDFAMLGNATQDGTPTPDTPQDIHVVTGDNTVIVAANSFDLNESIDTTHYRTTGDILSINNGELKLAGRSGSSSNTMRLQNFPGNMQYTVSFNFTTNPGRLLIRLRKLDDSGWLKNGDIEFTGWSFNNTYNAWYANTSLINGKQVLTFTVPKCLYWQLGFVNPASNDQIFSNILLEPGDTVHSYIPYQAPQTQLLSLGSIELAKIGDYTDRIFKAVQGNSIYDSLDSTTKASLNVGSWYKQNILKNVTYNGTENWNVSNAGNGTKRAYLTVSDVATNNEASGAYIMSNYLEKITTGASWSNDVTGISINSDSRQILLKFVSTMEIDTKEKVKAWLSTHNLDAWYLLMAPTYTPITDETLPAQLENILSMHTNKNVTNAWIEPSGTNAQAGLTLTYYRDLETVIDNISNAIISLGGNV